MENKGKYKVKVLKNIVSDEQDVCLIKGSIGNLIMESNKDILFLNAVHFNNEGIWYLRDGVIERLHPLEEEVLNNNEKI